ncbi:fungal-specific transcription factor domain-containing protein [Aspergillus californicus]
MELEQQLAQLTGLVSSNDSNRNPDDANTLSMHRTINTVEVSAQPSTNKITRPRSLADGLKMLSLEATAEKYVGSSSGIAFAKLTQAVLCRLSPDQDAFVFGDETPQYEQDVLPSLEASLDPNLAFMELDMMLESPQHLMLAAEDRCDVENPVELSQLGAPHIASLLDFYFAHSHTLYPIIQKERLVTALWEAYADPGTASGQSPLWLFRIWMVLAIGSTTYCSVTLMDETESIQLFGKAMTYFEAAMGCGDLAALEVLMLQVSYAFFNSAGPNTWFLVGVAARMAIGMGLHTREVYEPLPADIADYQKRLWFSLYMMDRVVSMALGRPFAIQDDDITPFADADDENITPEGIRPTANLSPSSMAVPLHILDLRKIATDIGINNHSVKRGLQDTRSQDQRSQATQALHRRLIDWRRSMPFPLPDTKSNVPHLCTSWFDLNYYTHLMMLYRPPAGEQTVYDAESLEILANSSGMAIQEAGNLYRQQRFAFNWLNLMTVFNSVLSLMYSTTAQRGDLAGVLQRTSAIQDLELAVEMLHRFCVKFPSALQIKDMVQTVLLRFKSA